jgi:ribosomal protein S18 acetylase RimI-like enzyme
MRDYVAATSGWDEAQEKEIFTEYFDVSSYQISVIVLDGRDVGYLKIERSAKEIFLANVHVHPDYQNQGVGSSVIKSLLVDAKQEGVVVNLKVLKVNHAAQRLYKKFGFSIEKEAEDYYLMQALPCRK